MKRMIKEKIEEMRPHAFEKKVLEREKAKGVPNVDLFYQKTTSEVEDINLAVIRRDMKRKGEDITTAEMEEIGKIVKVKDHMIPVSIYKRKDTKEKANAVLFLHGGGFIGGDVATKENQCKYLAEQSGAVVVSPEYRLAPETPYPGAIEDVMGTLEWMVEYAECLGIHKDKIAILGESAGGTLAANCCLRDQKGSIKLALYIYGAFDLAAAEETDYHWDYSLYDMVDDQEQKDYIMNRLFRFKELTTSVDALYVLDGTSIKDEGVSPFYAKDLSHMPKTVMIEAEFDYYRICNEEFAKRLEAAGVDTEIIFYEGLDHGFFDRLGSLPQTADCIDELAKRIKEM